MHDFDLIYWDSEESTANVAVEEIDHFVARGMRRVFGRGDQFGRYRTFNMDIWRDRSGRLLMRCWSQNKDVDWRSFEIKGIELSRIPDFDSSHGCQDAWLPRTVRDAYEEWIREEY